IKSDLIRIRRPIVVVRTEPSDEIEDVGVSPHPRRESLKTVQRGNGILIVADAANIFIDPIGIRKIRLDGYGDESFIRDQSFCNLRALAIKLVSTMRGLSDKNEPCVADRIEESIVIGVLISSQLMSVVGYASNEIRLRTCHNYPLENNQLT